MPPKRWKPTKAQIDAAHGQTIADVIADRLDVLFCGINPSLYSAAVGHHFARPGNRFWPALHRANLTDRQLSPFEDRRLLDVGCGLTNVVDRATARADKLAASELREGALALAEKVQRHRPRCLAVLGVTAYRAGFGEPGAQVGPQDATLGETLVWVLPNPSGLNAHYQLPDLAQLFAEMHATASIG